MVVKNEASCAFVSDVGPEPDVSGQPQTNGAKYQGMHDAVSFESVGQGSEAPKGEIGAEQIELPLVANWIRVCGYHSQSEYTRQAIESHQSHAAGR